MKKRLNKIGHWIIDRITHIPERDRHIQTWFIGFLLATTVSATIYALGNPIGNTFSAHAMNIGTIVGMNGLLFLIWTIIVSALLSFIYLPLPRIFLAAFSYTAFSGITILLKESSGKLFSYIIGFSYSLFTVIICLFFIMLFHKKIGRKIKISIVAVVLILISTILVFDQIKVKQTAIPVMAENIDHATVESPGKAGTYDYTFFTYGSGEDIHREWFGKAVSEVTPTVDASHFITKWGKDREKFWGFTQSQLPINGRTFLPEGEGPFPIILMVHGNHTMEYFSTSGYDYLGEQLASRGFIAISVDEDFINYSNVLGSPNNNYELRAWMLLQHLAHLQQMNESPGHHLYKKIDFDQVGLMGHSRGGQAILMATDYMTFFDNEDDASLIESMENVDIKGLVAIAPTDRLIDEKRPTTHNVSYLLLHGARDADVSDYSNDRQFYRATFDRDYEGFKASLYIADANHTQFNTDWGRMDLSLPRGLFLNKRQTMAPEEQQQIAKVYMSAFFESVFNKDKTYELLFQDYQYGGNWLPDTTFISKYRHASYRPIKTFNSKQDEEIDGTGFIKSETVTPLHRRGAKRFRDSLQLEWSEEAFYSVDSSNFRLNKDQIISLTMANNDEQETTFVPQINVVLETTYGVSVQLPLDDFMPFQPVISTEFTHFGLFDGIFRDKYNESWEPVFQTFEIPIETFAETYPELDVDQINKITLHFASQPGKILVEEIGVY